MGAAQLTRHIRGRKSATFDKDQTCSCEGTRNGACESVNRMDSEKLGSAPVELGRPSHESRYADHHHDADEADGDLHRKPI